MDSWIAVIVIAVIVVMIIVAAALLIRRRRSSTSEPAATPPPAAPPAAPMTDLEAALAQVTDRDGRPIRERIEAASVHVDPLRDPDDTGPLLRRALDSVGHHDDEPAVDDLAADHPGPRPTDA